MKKLIAISFIFSFVGIHGQSPNRLSKDTLKPKQKIDTIILQSDSTKVNSIDNKCSLKIILVKEDKSVDFFKYILPIFTLILGIGINKGLDYWSDRKKIKKVGKRWIAEIRCFESPIIMQIGVLEDYLKLHSKDTFETYNLPIYSILNCEVFKSLDKGDLLKYIELTKKTDYKEVVKSSNTIHGYISILSYLYETLKSDFDSYKSETNRFVNSINDNLQDLLREFADYGVLLEKELASDPISNTRFKLISDLISKHILPKRQTGNYDVFELENVFFMPLLAILADLRLDERTKPLANYTSNCLNDIKGIRLEKQYMTENLTIIIAGYKKQLGELETIINTIENK